MKRSLTHLDASQTVFFEKQLEHVKAKSYDKKYPELKQRSLIPVSFEADAGDDTIVYEQYDMFGMAKIVEAYAKDFPRVDVAAKEFRAPVKSLGDSYGYSIQEIRRAAKKGVPLTQRKANAAKKAIMQKEKDLAYFGDAKCGWTGLFNHPNVPVVTQASASAAAWESKTADEIINDLNKLVDSIVETTQDIEVPNTLLLPINKYTLISSKRIPDTSMTVKDFFLAAHGEIKRVERLSDLNEAGAAGATRMMAYKLDPDTLEMEVPQDFEQFEPHLHAMEYVVHCHQRFGGVSFYYPLAAAYMDGI